MTTTYREIVDEALAADEVRKYNVVALGDGENPGDALICLVCDAQRVIAIDTGFECQGCGALYDLDELHPGEYPGDFETVTMMSEGRDNAL